MQHRHRTEINAAVNREAYLGTLRSVDDLDGKGLPISPSVFIVHTPAISQDRLGISN